MEVGTFPAGWYQDYQNAALLRWWDSTQWTAHTQPRPGPGPVPAGTQANAANSAPGMGSAQTPGFVG